MRNSPMKETCKHCGRPIFLSLKPTPKWVTKKRSWKCNINALHFPVKSHEPREKGVAAA